MDPKETSDAPASDPTATNGAPTPPVDTTPSGDVSVSMADPVSSGTPSAATTTNPGHTLGIVSLILSILGVGLIGLILGIVGLKKSKQAGQKNGLALAGIIVGAINMVVVTIIVIVVTTGIAQLAGKCAELGDGVHVEGGVTYTCGTSTNTTTPSELFGN